MGSAGRGGAGSVGRGGVGSRGRGGAGSAGRGGVGSAGCIHTQHSPSAVVHSTLAPTEQDLAHDRPQYRVLVHLPHHRSEIKDTITHKRVNSCSRQQRAHTAQDTIMSISIASHMSVWVGELMCEWVGPTALQNHLSLVP